jgi:putative polyhydroxyalkanoate system protein
MPDIRIRRDHELGLAKARQLALKWAEDAERKLDMECTILEGEDSDTVEFKRTGVTGTLHVAADHFDLHAKLGFLLGAFAGRIEQEIESNIDALLEDAGKGKAAKKATSGSRSGPRTPSSRRRRSCPSARSRRPTSHGRPCR